MSLAAEVISEDHRLEQTANRANGELARHRWHWTLDESNPKRVNFSEYGRQVGRNESRIRAMASGYALWLDKNSTAGASDSDIQDSIAQASMKSETHAATHAVGKARGITTDQARKTREAEVRRVRDIARERAEKQGTSIEEEAPKIAEQIVKQEQADAQLAEDRKARLGLRFVKVENILAAMYRRGTEALTEMRDIPWEDEHRELLIASLANIKAILNLIDLALTGAADVDWDAELAKLS